MNLLLIADTTNSDLPTITILDKEYANTESFFSWPISFLEHWGWVVIGEL